MAPLSAIEKQKAAFFSEKPSILSPFSETPSIQRQLHPTAHDRPTGIVRIEEPRRAAGPWSKR
jgi:hypothetical protein